MSGNDADTSVGLGMRVVGLGMWLDLSASLRKSFNGGGGKKS